MPITWILNFSLITTLIMVQIGLKELIWSISPLTIFKTSSSQFHPVYMRDRFSKYLIFQRVDVKMSIDDFPFRCSFVYARKKSVRSMCAFCINISIVLFADWIFLQAHVFRRSGKRWNMQIFGNLCTDKWLAGGKEKLTEYFLFDFFFHLFISKNGLKPLSCPLGPCFRF